MDLQNKNVTTRYEKKMILYKFCPNVIDFVFIRIFYDQNSILWGRVLGGVLGCVVARSRLFPYNIKEKV